MTNVPLVFSVAPMTLSRRDLDRHRLARSASLASTAEAPSVTSPSTGTFSPGRTRRRSPTATSSSGTSTSASPVTRRAVVACRPTSRRIAPVVLLLGTVLEPATEQDQADDDRRRVEVRLRVQAGLVDDLRERGSPPRCRPRRLSCRWRRACPCSWSVARRPPGRPIEAPTGPRLDDGRRPEDQPVDRRHRDARLGQRTSRP